MRIASALGDEDDVIAAFHGCEQAPAGLGSRWSTAARQLLERPRR